MKFISQVQQIMMVNLKQYFQTAKNKNFALTFAKCNFQTARDKAIFKKYLLYYDWILIVLLLY